jgi:hypothetical protein
MRILALDTSTEWCSVAVGDGTHWHRLDEHAGQAHSERILPMVHAALAGAGWSLAILDGIAFGSGPGSFTGVRIGCGLFGASQPYDYRYSYYGSSASPFAVDRAAWDVILPLMCATGRCLLQLAPDREPQVSLEWDGAEPWEFQFGTEVSRPGPTGPSTTR